MSTKTYDVICIGLICQDMIMSGLARGGLEEDGTTVYADSFTYTVGGDCANGAVILSRLKNHTGLLTVVDDKQTGTMIREELIREGVDVEPVKVSSEGESMISVVLVRPDGSHNFILPRTQTPTLKKTDYDLEMFRHTKVVSANSLFSLGSIDTDGIEEIFRTVQESGGKTVADTNLDLWGIGPRGVDKVFPYTDYLIPSYSEALYITGKETDDDIADFLLEKGVKHVILKKGSEGCFFKSREERFYVPAYKIEAVDTTGCGDNFTAGIVHGLLHGWDHQRITRFACACGAVNAMAVGAHAGVKSEEQVLAFMEEQQRI